MARAILRMIPPNLNRFGGHANSPDFAVSTPPRIQHLTALCSLRPVVLCDLCPALRSSSTFVRTFGFSLKFPMPPPPQRLFEQNGLFFIRMRARALFEYQSDNRYFRLLTR